MPDYGLPPGGPRRKIKMVCAGPVKNTRKPYADKNPCKALSAFLILREKGRKSNTHKEEKR